MRSSLVQFLVPVSAAMLLGGSCAAVILDFVGAAILWHVASIAAAAVLLAIVSSKCPGGHGVIRWIRGCLAIMLGFAALVGASLCFLIFYRLILAALAVAPSLDLAVHAALMLLILLFMDLCFASEFVATLAAVIEPDQQCRSTDRNNTLGGGC